MQNTETSERETENRALPAPMPSLRRKRASAFGALLNVELAIVVALVLAFIAPQPFGFVPDVVMSDSMGPDIPEGSVAWIDENVGADALKVGDVAVYSPTPGKQVMHRVAAINDGGTLTFKGDANASPDAGEAGPSQVVGRYMFHVPQIGHAYALFDRNRVAAILIIVVLNLSVYALSAWQQRRDERDERDARECMEGYIESEVSRRLGTGTQL